MSYVYGILLNLTIMNPNKVIVRSLYRNTLRQCVKLGYVCGKEANYNRYPVNYNSITRTKLRKARRRGNMGNYLFNHLRYYYDIGANVKDSQCQEELIDYGFATLRMFNNIVAGHSAELYDSYPPVYLLEG